MNAEQEVKLERAEMRMVSGWWDVWSVTEREEDKC